ncbi:hypothetical protein ATE84_2945 [Aquimarina sp. MAR_2010_214]|uniref:hypothetical protein n=1 Tax=Aquimarina sp. MAR_2010_214 TaxID=1250026 RepID=UPI000C709152|nr:hypothetical protein [Aquimarina sp. MAR_2010_214]PKV50877.1 hypothetical protein ATE84_2945 [Aquimarina sp. MAR_2010_214]
MTLEAFNLLPESNQYKVVFSQGTFVDSFMEDQERYILFAIERFYVEIHFTGYSDDVVYIKAFRTSHLLNKYLPETID